MAPRVRLFPSGIHVPSLTFFKDDARQEIDWGVQERHFDFLSAAGVHGIIIAGSNGEAVTLSTAEKKALVVLARKRAHQLDRPDITLVLGCNGQSTRHVIDETIAAHAVGADFALVLVPSYFHFAMDSAAIVSFFEEVADNSPVPVVVYNYPGVTAGLDISSDMLIELSRHANIAGVKLTCGGIGKVPRVTAQTGSSNGFGVLSGQIDWMGPALSVGAIGAITGMANLYPRSCVELYNLYKAGKTQQAAHLQLTVATAESAFGKGGINGSKWVVATLLGYPSAACRRPYPAFTNRTKQEEMVTVVERLRMIEERLTSRQ